MAQAARKSVLIAQRASLSRPAEQRTPEIIAIERLARLVTTGAPRVKLVTTARHIMADWRAERIEPGERRERVEKLIEDIDLGIEAAENFVYEAETDGARKGALGQLEGLKAVKVVLMQTVAGE